MIALLTILFGLELPGLINNVHDKISLPLIISCSPGMSTNTGLKSGSTRVGEQASSYRYLIQGVTSPFQDPSSERRRPPLSWVGPNSPAPFGWHLIPCHQLTLASKGPNPRATFRPPRRQVPSDQPGRVLGWGLHLPSAPWGKGDAGPALPGGLAEPRRWQTASHVGQWGRSAAGRVGGENKAPSCQ